MPGRKCLQKITGRNSSRFLSEVLAVFIRVMSPEKLERKKDTRGCFRINMREGLGVHMRHTTYSEDIIATDESLLMHAPLQQMNHYSCTHHCNRWTTPHARTIATDEPLLMHAPLQQMNHSSCTHHCNRWTTPQAHTIATDEPLIMHAPSTYRYYKNA